MGEQNTKRRHAGADDADVDLDGGPERHVPLVPSGVCGGGEGDKRAEPQHRDNCDAVILPVSLDLGRAAGDKVELWGQRTKFPL